MYLRYSLVRVLFLVDLAGMTTAEEPEIKISILTLTTKWQFDTYGLSTVNKSLVNNLRVVDPKGKKIKITCAIVEEEKNIKDGHFSTGTAEGDHSF